MIDNEMKQKALDYIDENPLNSRTLELNTENSKRKVNEDHYFHFCEKCGMIEFCTYSDETKEKLKKEKICFKCDFWNEIVKTKSRKLIFENSDGFRNCYLPSGIVTNQSNSFLGCGGSVWNFWRLNSDNNEVEITNNMWCQGTVPPDFYDELPVNAINLSTYIKVGDYLELNVPELNNSNTEEIIKIGDEIFSDDYGVIYLDDDKKLKIEPEKKKFMKSKYNHNTKTRTWILNISAEKHFELFKGIN